VECIPLKMAYVMDEGNVLGWGKSVTVSTFKKNLRALINEILI
jgi:hypothetical protein